MKNILITGANGQLGNEFLEIQEHFENLSYVFVFTDIMELDITDKSQLDVFFSKNKFDVIINCAAYTAVDKAEEDSEKAFLINVEAPRMLAEQANKQNALLIHFSTDYVFDGKGHLPLSEVDEINPLSVYAESKAEGEKAVLNSANRAVVFRTSWLYSPFGNNFVSTMRRFGEERDQLKVIYDQVGTPTYAADLADCVIRYLDKFIELEKPTLFHFSNEGVASWYDFAIAIMELSGIICEVSPIRTEEYPLPAARPSYSLLDKKKIKTLTGCKIPNWRDSLRLCIERIDECEMDR